MEAVASFFLPRLRSGGQLVVPWGEAGAAWAQAGRVGSCPACPPPGGVVDTIGEHNAYPNSGFISLVDGGFCNLFAQMSWTEY